jgi:hypothetical protein
MYVRGYLQGSENGRVDTIEAVPAPQVTPVVLLFVLCSGLIEVDLKTDVPREDVYIGDKYTTENYISFSRFNMISDKC